VFRGVVVRAHRELLDVVLRKAHVLQVERNVAPRIVERFAGTATVIVPVAGNDHGARNVRPAALDAQAAIVDREIQPDVIEGQCLIALTQLKLAVLKACADAGKSPDTAQNLLLLNADEAGHFTLAGVRSERFVIIGIGKAGMNSALWISSPLTMSEQKEIKLTQPTLSCYDTDAVTD